MPLLNLTIDARFNFDSRGRLRVRVLDPAAPGWRLLDGLPFFIRYRLRVAERVFGRIAADRRDVHYFQKAADGFRLNIDCANDPRQLVPADGPLMVIANHPLNGIDGIAIAAALSQYRPDLKVMLTQTFDGVPGLAEHAIFVNASNGPGARSRSAPTREAINWLRDGHAVLLFPAGQGSWIEMEGHRDPVDSTWSSGITMFLRNAGATALPVYVEGSPSRLFLRTRRSWPVLSTLFLLREILIQEGTTVRFRIGQPVPAEQVLALETREEQVQLLRDRTYALGKA